MTPDEMQAIKTRLAAAEDKRRRVEYLRDTLDQLKGGAVNKVGARLTPDRGEAAIFYSTPRSTNYTDVCWSRNEEGLADELLAAIVAIVQKRLDAAEQEFAAA